MRGQLRMLPGRCADTLGIVDGCGILSSVLPPFERRALGTSYQDITKERELKEIKMYTDNFALSFLKGSLLIIGDCYMIARALWRAFLRPSPRPTLRLLIRLGAPKAASRAQIVPPFSRRSRIHWRPFFKLPPADAPPAVFGAPFHASPPFQNH